MREILGIVETPARESMRARRLLFSLSLLALQTWNAASSFPLFLGLLFGAFGLQTLTLFARKEKGRPGNCLAAEEVVQNKMRLR